MNAISAESLLENDYDNRDKIQVGIIETNQVADTKPDLNLQYQIALEILHRINRPICRPPA